MKKFALISNKSRQRECYMLADDLKYQRLKRNPLIELQNNVFKKINNWRNKGYIGKIIY